VRWLSIITILPLTAGVAAAALSRIRPATGFWVARVFLMVLTGIILWQCFSYQPKFDDPKSLWIIEEPLLISGQWAMIYAPAADGINLLPALSAVVLTTMAFFVSTAGPLSSMLLLLGALSCSLGALFAKDLLLFIIFMESALSLNLFSIALKGRRLFGAVRRAFIMQAVTGAPMLLAVLAIHWKAGGPGFLPADLIEATLEFSPEIQLLLASAYCVTLGSRVPLVPMHGWFMEISDESDPASATTLFALVSLVAIYGFIRFAMPMFPAVSPVFWTLVGAMAALGLTHMGLIAFFRRSPAQILTRARAVVASLAIVGVVSATRPAVAGAVFILSTQGLAFASVCMMLVALDKRGNPPPEIIALKMPRLATMAFIAILGIIGLPGTTGFVGNILTLGGSFRSHPVMAATAALGMATISGSLLTLPWRAFGQKATATTVQTPRLRFEESAPMVAILIIIVALGVFPGVVLSRISPSVDRLCEELRHRRTMARVIEEPVRAVEDPTDSGANKKPPMLLDKAP